VGGGTVSEGGSRRGCAGQCGSARTAGLVSKSNHLITGGNRRSNEQEVKMLLRNVKRSSVT
jgi:hypothetical protein